MVEVYAALAPVFLIIIAGWLVRALGIVSRELMADVNRFGYFVLYPAFLFETIAKSDLISADAGRFVIGVLLSFACIAVLSLTTRFVIRDAPAFTSVFQGALRWNGFAILAAADNVFGKGARDYIALVFGPTVLFINVICVTVLAIWGQGGKASPRFILSQLIGNPLVLACGVSLIARFLHLPSFKPVDDALGLLGQAAMPVALLCVGAGLDLKAARASLGAVSLAAITRLGVSPVLFYVIVLACGGSAQAAAIAVGIGATPTAAASYALAREMGGDAKLMAAIVTLTTVISFVTMPLAIALALGAGQ